MSRPPMTEQVHGDFGDGDSKRGAVDRNYAVGLAAPLGIALARVAAKQSAAHLHQAIYALTDAMCQANHYARADDRDRLERLASIAMAEWLAPNCGRCEGRGFVDPGQKALTMRRMTCPKCMGCGRKQYTYGDRSRAFGKKLTTIEEKRILDALDLLREHNYLLGRSVTSVLR